MSTPNVYPRVIEWSSTGVVAYDVVTRQLTSASNLADLSASFSGGPVLMSVSRRSTFVKAVRVPNAGANEIKLILQTQMADMFPVPLSELSYSFRLTDDVSPEGRLAIVAAMRETDLKTLLAEAKEAGFKVGRVIPAGFGSLLLAESLGQRDSAVVQKTAEGLSIDVLSNGELRYSRVAPLPPNAQLIDAEIGRTFAAVNLPCAPTIAAGGLDFADADTISAIPSIEALATMPLDRLGIDIETREAVENREKAALNKRTRLAVLMCASAVLLMTLVLVERSDKAAEAQMGTARWQRILTGLRNDRKKAETAQNTTLKLGDTIKRAFEPAQRVSDVFTVVTNHVPKGVWLTSLTFERGKVMYIRGTAVDSAAVGDFLAALTTEPRLRNVTLAFATNGEIDKTPIVQFSIQGFPVGNLPLADAKKKGAKK